MPKFLHVHTRTGGVYKKDDGNTRKYIDAFGNVYPSITTILGSIEDENITTWRKEVGEKKANSILKHATTRGTQVHMMIETYLKNGAIFPSDYWKYSIKIFNQLKPLLNNINIIYGLEKPLYSAKWGIAGTVDCVAGYNGKLSIIDFKTSLRNKTDKMIEKYFLQCTAYAIMWQEQTNMDIDNIIILMGTEYDGLPLKWEKSIKENGYKEDLRKIIKNYKENFYGNSQ